MIRRTLLKLAAVVVAANMLFGAVAFAEVKTPSTVIHHVTLKWKEGVSDADKQKAMDGMKAILAEIPGALNLWTKTIKVQPKEYSQTFVIEFENEAALKAYGAHPKKKEWDDFYYNIRETSLNSVTSN